MLHHTRKGMILFLFFFILIYYVEASNIQNLSYNFGTTGFIVTNCTLNRTMIRSNFLKYPTPVTIAGKSWYCLKSDASMVDADNFLDNRSDTTLIRTPAGGHFNFASAVSCTTNCYTNYATFMQDPVTFRNGSVLSFSCSGWRKATTGSPGIGGIGFYDDNNLHGFTINFMRRNTLYSCSATDHPLNCCEYFNGAGYCNAKECNNIAEWRHKGMNLDLCSECAKKSGISNKNFIKID